jgi:hypothetical protein
MILALPLSLLGIVLIVLSLVLSHHAPATR